MTRARLADPEGDAPVSAAAGRGPRTRRWTSEPPTPDEAAEAVLAEEVQAARGHVDRLRRDVAAGRDGAAALNAAEYRLAGALDRYVAARDQGGDA